MQIDVGLEAGVLHADVESYEEIAGVELVAGAVQLRLMLAGQAESHYKVRYVLDDLPSQIVEQMASCPSREIWLTVIMEEGETHRVSGDIVRPLLDRLAHTPAAS